MAELDVVGSDLDRWLEPFLAALGHKKRRGWAPLYLRGLLGPSERKSLQPMAASLGLSGHDQLRHFIASPAWEDAPLWRVLADAGYGAGAAFRHGLGKRGLAWAVGIPRHQKVYGADVRLVPPGGRKRRPVPDQEPREAEAVLAGLPWRRVTWRHGSKGPLAARFAATRIRAGDGATWANNRHLPGEEVWLVGEWRSNGERKYYLSNLPPRTALRALAAAIKARWVCEQGHQQLKQELGLGHFEGRSWTGLHRHALMTCIAFAYLQTLRLAGQRSTG